MNFHKMRELRSRQEHALTVEKSYGKFVLHGLVILLGLIGLFLLSVWAERKSEDVDGPLRMVKGPHDAIYVHVDRSIAKVSSEGELLSVINLHTDASVPAIADFFVEEDGRLLFARRDSQLLQYYFPDTKLLTTHLRIPSQPVGENNSYSLTKDPSTGTLYFADTSRHLIRIFGPDRKEVKTITVPSGNQAFSLIGSRIEVSDLERVFSAETALRYPKGLTFADDRLLAADTGNSRIIIFYPDGTLDKIVPVFPLESTNFINPVKVDRIGDAIYVVVRGPGFIGGKVQSFESHTGLPRKFSYPGASDPLDILARRDDVLVADRASLAVLRYSHSGRFLGTFGDPGLQSLYAGSQFKRKMYEWIRIGSLTGMIAVLVWIVFASISRLAALQNVLGPLRSARRKMLLLIPGMGQAAAGRPLRAGILLIVLLYFVSLVIYFWLQYRASVNTSLSLPLLITTGLMAYSVWIFIVLDGIRLTGREPDNEDFSIEKRRLQAAFFPLITVCSATAIQLAREVIVYGYPEAPPAIQQLFDFVITSTRGRSSIFTASLSSSIVFGWGGAAAAVFGAFAWQENARRSKIATGIVAGFLTGMYSWLFTVVLVGDSLGWMLYAPPIQGAVLGLFLYLYFRKKGMPVLIIPVAVTGAWIGYFLKFFFSVLASPIGKILSQGDAGGLWTGAVARLELILMPAFFIHIAVWITWSIASNGPKVKGTSEVLEDVQKDPAPITES